MPPHREPPNTQKCHQLNKMMHTPVYNENESFYLADDIFEYWEAPYEEA